MRKRVAGAIQTIASMLDKAWMRCAALTMLGKTIEHAHQQVLLLVLVLCPVPLPSAWSRASAPVSGSRSRQCATTCYCKYKTLVRTAMLARRQIIPALKQQMIAFLASDFAHPTASPDPIWHPKP